jgi:hypothetical protein
MQIRTYKVIAENENTGERRERLFPNARAAERAAHAYRMGFPWRALVVPVVLEGEEVTP